MRREADVVIVGGGITGAATLRALARSGHDAVLVEQFALGHDRGSSHGSSRIFRLAYPDATYTRLALDALEPWRMLEEECGEQLIVRTGTLDLGDAAEDIERSLRSHSLPFELLTGDVAATRWPITFEPKTTVVFQPDGGFLRADRALAALAAGARSAGATVAERERATRIEPAVNGITVVTENGEIAARAAVVAAGAWARHLLAPAGVDLPVAPTRETVVYFACAGAEGLPPLIEYPWSANGLPVGQAFYALPAPGRGLKAGIHHSGPPTDPEQVGVPDGAVVEATLSWVAKRFPTAEPDPLAVETCLYTNTADESFIVSRHDRIVTASACSGHGFKFAPVIGARAAALAVEAMG